MHPGVLFYPGSVLPSHPVTRAVPSALEGLTSVFGMGTGVSPPEGSHPEAERDEAAGRRGWCIAISPGRSVYVTSPEEVYYDPATRTRLFGCRSWARWSDRHATRSRHVPA